ncbi:MAG: hypothetical protein QNL21_08635 [Flavobacteriales bacterium]|jgi:phosphatidylglycerophosphate synthase
MSKRLFIIVYIIFSLTVFSLAAANYFGVEKNLWWFACMLSGFISSTYCHFWLKNKITEESFVNFIMTIFILASFLISFGLALYLGGKEHLPVVLCGLNVLIWIVYSSWLSKKLV